MGIWFCPREPCRRGKAGVGTSQRAASLPDVGGGGEGQDTLSVVGGHSRAQRGALRPPDETKVSFPLTGTQNAFCCFHLETSFLLFPYWGALT